MLNNSNQMIEKNYRSKIESVRTDIYNSWKKTQSPVSEVNI